MFEGMSARQMVEFARQKQTNQGSNQDIIWGKTIKDAAGDNYTALVYMDGERIVDACILDYFGNDVTNVASYRWPS